MNMDKNAISVIIPAFNEIEVLPSCLDALMRQDYPAGLEIIVVDDGSTDGSAEYARSRGIKVVRQDNRGPGPARNAGANIASGELLVFTDADCIPDPDFVRALVKPLEDPRISGSMGVFYSAQKSLTARFIQQEASERYRKEGRVLYIDWVATYAACYRKDVFLRYGGFTTDKKMICSEDAELSFRLAEEGCKMVLAPQARCRHVHPEKIADFMRSKYLRAYWTARLLSVYPGRLVKDKMTPASRKGMMVLMSAAAACLAAGIWWKPALYAGVFSSLLLLASTLPFSFRAMKNDPVLALVAPAFLLLRTACYVAGAVKGLIDDRQNQPAQN